VAQSGFGAQVTEDSRRLAEVRAPKPLGRWGRFGVPADEDSSMNILQAGAGETEQKLPFKNFSAADIKKRFSIYKKIFARLRTQEYLAHFAAAQNAPNTKKSNLIRLAGQGQPARRPRRANERAAKRAME